MKNVLAVLLLAGLGACGSTQWQPKSAMPPPVVYVTERCEMEPLQAPAQPQKTRCSDGQPGCYDKANAQRLALRVAAMERWIESARRNCSIMEYDQASYRLLPPYRRESSISVARSRLSGGPR